MINLKYFFKGIEVVKGIEVLDQIEGVETNDQDRPIQDIFMSISIVKEPK